jgi:hypothetical protein
MPESEEGMKFDVLVTRPDVWRANANWALLHATLDVEFFVTSLPTRFCDKPSR